MTFGVPGSFSTKGKRLTESALFITFFAAVASFTEVDRPFLFFSAGGKRYIG